MRITDWLDKEEMAKKYQVFKGYPVKERNRKESMEQHYVVPWEMPHEECKKQIH